MIQGFSVAAAAVAAAGFQAGRSFSLVSLLARRTKRTTFALFALITAVGPQLVAPNLYPYRLGIINLFRLFYSSHRVVSRRGEGGNVSYPDNDLQK